MYSLVPEDNDRYLWTSTSKGIFRFDTETGGFFDFPLHPLMMGSEFNRCAYFKASNGQIYFGANEPQSPTVTFFPKEVMDYYENVTLSKASITLHSFVKYDGEKEEAVTNNIGLQALDEIVLQPGDRYFSLEFLVADYRSPKDNYYSYYLGSYEKDWNTPARNNNFVRYENLPPGTYTLKMRGALMRNSVAQNERSIKVVVLPYWYQTWWAKVLFGLAVAGGFYLFYKYQLKRQLETQEAIRLRDLDSLKTRLYTNITHEFRTPLTVIMGMNDNIHGHEQEKNLIKRNAKNLLRLINQLLDLSKLDSGTLKMDTVQGDIVGYLQYLTESFYSMATDKKVHLRFQPEVDSLIMDFDEVKVQHVLYNLLSNAIKFTKPGGKVALEVNETNRNGQPFLKIKVKDTGTGIGEAGGTGIGLALTKELVELMGGQISVKSEKGWGSEFTVLLPVKREIVTPKVETYVPATYSENELVPDFHALPPTDRKTDEDKPIVLVIEDNAGVVTYVESLLKKDYTVLVARNGRKGVDMAFEQIPDLVITDVMMPEMDGFEVCTALKKDERTSHIPIVMLTAKAGLDSKLEGLETGVDVYLAKPFEKEELLIRLRKLLELRKQLQAFYSKMESATLPDAAVPSKVESTFLNKLKKVVNARLGDAELSPDDLCKAVFLSNTQVNRKLKALTGQTPSQFIRSIRLQKAIELLKTTDMTISEVTWEVGFNDPNYFSRMFKQEYGKAPGEVKG